MIADIIADMLKRGERIIVPGLGSFMIDKSKEDCTFFFNEHISYDDGNLSDIVAEKEDISFAEAEAQIKRFVYKAIDKLDEGDNIEIPGIGYLTKNKRKIVLKCPGEEEVPLYEKDTERVAPADTEDSGLSVNKNENSNSVKKEITPGEPVEKNTHQEEFRQESKPEAEIEEEINPSEESEEEKELEASSQIQTEDEIPEMSAQEKRRLDILKLREQRVNERKGYKKDILGRRAKNIQKNGPEYKKRKRRTLMWFFAAIFLIMAAAIYALVFKDDLIKNRAQLFGDEIHEETDAPSETTITGAGDEDEPANNDEVGVEETGENDEVIEAAGQNSGQLPAASAGAGVQSANSQPRENNDYLTPPAAKPNKFQVVGGSFKSRSNAIQFAKQMHAKGYDVKYLGYVNNFHSVSMGSFDTRNAARELQKKLMFRENMDSWVFKY